MEWMLYVIVVWSFAWPVYRAFLNIEIENNEGWNAYFADAAMGKMPLYPSADQLITNNYPPLSFYVVGLVGRLVGDPVLAGRLLSLIAVVAIAAAISLSRQNECGILRSDDEPILRLLRRDGRAPTPRRSHHGLWFSGISNRQIE